MSKYVPLYLANSKKTLTDLNNGRQLKRGGNSESLVEALTQQQRVEAAKSARGE